MIVLSCNMDDGNKVEKIRKSCEILGYEYQTYGSEVWFVNFRQAKIDEFLKALYEIKDKYVCFSDGWDSWMLRPGVLSKFNHYFKGKVLISGNRGLHPARDLDYPDSPTSFRFINAGQMMGETKLLIKTIETIRDNYKGYDDQEGWNECFSKGLLKDVVIDYKCRIFLNMTDVRLDELYVNQKKLYLKETKQAPYSIHFGGPKGDDPNFHNMNETFNKWINL